MRRRRSGSGTHDATGAFKESFSGKQYVPRRERSRDALKASARMLVRSYRSEVAGREKDRDVREEETALFVDSVVAMCRQDDKSHGNADARERFCQLGEDERLLEQKMAAVTAVYEKDCGNDERDKAHKMQVVSQAKSIRDEGLAPLKKDKKSLARLRRRMEKEKERFLQAARAALDIVAEAGDEAIKLKAGQRTIGGQQAGGEQRSDQIQTITLGQSQSEGSFARIGAGEGADTTGVGRPCKAKRRKPKTKAQMEFEIAALEKERHKTKNPVRRKEVCLLLGKLYVKLGQGARALPILQAATQPVTRAELIEMELGVDEELFDLEEDEEDALKLVAAEDAQRRRRRGAHWALGLLYLLDSTYDAKQAGLQFGHWLNSCVPSAPSSTREGATTSSTPGRAVTRAPALVSDRLRSLRALEGVLMAAEEVDELRCQLHGARTDEAARHIRHSLLHIKDLRTRVNEELVGVGVGDEFGVGCGGTKALEALGWLYADRRELVESRQLLEYKARCEVRVPFSGSMERSR